MSVRVRLGRPPAVGNRPRAVESRAGNGGGITEGQMAERILITGHQGYVGSAMTPMAVKAGYDVTGLDIGYFAECTLVPDEADVPFIRKDLRDLEPRDLEGFDAVIHLAALSNDPIGNLNSAWTQEINTQGSIRLAELAKAAGA